MIRGKTMQNRFEAAPVSMGPVTRGGLPSESTCAEVEIHAADGYGIYVIGEVDVNSEGVNHTIGFRYDFSDMSEENLKPYKWAAETIKKYGSLALIEINHCGFLSDGEDVYGPSEMERKDGVHVKEMDEALIRKVISDFVQTAIFMQKAGYDGVLCHFGHGWLIQQFLSPMTNHRTDEYGGSIENRCRLAVEILKEIRKQTGEEFIIEVRMSGDEMDPKGYKYREFLKFADILDPYLDIIHISMGSYHNPVRTREFSSEYHEKGCNAYISEALKKQGGNALVSVVGGINDPEVALEIIESNKSDIIALGRQKYADEHFIRKIKEGKEELVYPCLRCFCCFSGPGDSADRKNWTPGCSINPLHMHYEYENMPAPAELKKVIILGGGVAGLYFAACAAARGHQVTLLEKEEQTGGILNTVEPDPHKEAFIRYLKALKANAEAAGAEIRTGTVLTEEILKERKPDVVVSAIGAHGKEVSVPGEENIKVLNAVGAMEHLDEIGDQVVILGAGLIGSELAVFLREQGKDVSLTARSRMLKVVYPLHGAALRMQLFGNGVKVFEGISPKKITKDGVLMESADGKEEFLKADTVIKAFGMTSNESDAETLIKAADPDIEFYTIGDAKEPRRIRQATTEAFLLANQLGTDYSPKPLMSNFGPPPT